MTMMIHRNWENNDDREEEDGSRVFLVDKFENNKKNRLIFHMNLHN